MPADFFSHTGALAQGILPSGEVYPSHAVFWCCRKERAQGRGRMESAAALIGSQPCDVFIACLGCREGQVTIGLVLVSGGGRTSRGGWHSCGDFFSFFLLVMGGTGGARTIPSYLPLLNRHHGRIATWSTCVDTSYNGWDPVTMRQIWGQGTATTAGTPLTDRI
jgi:hypothetical protein